MSCVCEYTCMPCVYVGAHETWGHRRYTHACHMGEGPHECQVRDVHVSLVKSCRNSNACHVCE